MPVRRLGNSVLRCLMGATALVAISAGFAAAQDAYTYNIGPQPLRSALSQLAQQSGLNLAVPANATAGVTSAAVSGTMTPQQALASLLRGSGLTLVIVDGTVVLPPAGQNAALDDGSIVLGTIVVGGADAASGAGYRGTPDRVYDTPTATSVISREAMQSSGARSVRDALSATSGMFVSGDNNQSTGANVNLRGLQDQNRVVVTIDGARQNFQRSGHGSTGYTFVDPALLRAVEVEKSGNSGAGGAGALGGTVDFRTIRADDLIADDARHGSEISVATGTNEYHFAGSVASAVRLSDRASALFALSRKGLGEYDIGKSGSLGGGWDILGFDRPQFTGSENLAGLFKLETRPTDATRFDFSFMRNDSEYTKGGGETAGQIDRNRVKTDTLALDFGWQPGGDLIDLNFKLWANRTHDRENRSARDQFRAAVDVDYGMESFGFTLDNTSRLHLPVGELTLNYGIEAFRDLGSTIASGAGIAADPNEALWFSGASPGGRRDVASAFLTARLEHEDWLTVSGGLRYDYYRLNGAAQIFGTTITVYTPPSNCVRYYSDGVRCRIWGTPASYSYVYPTENVDVELSDSALLPTLRVAVKPTDGVQLFAGYSESYRPPTIMESFLGGSHILSFGPAFAPNPDLRAESAKTFELGMNHSADSLWRDGDSLRFKAVAFHRDVKDYVALGKVDRELATGTQAYTAYANLDGKTRMRGLELEGNYDAGGWYLGGALTWLDAKYASQYSYNGASYNTESFVILAPPKLMVTLDGGVRLMEDRLTLGARVSHFSMDRQSLGTLYSVLSAYASEDYTIADVYGSYRLNDKAVLGFAVNNVLDKAYVPAIGTTSLPGPGRTATISLNLKF